MQKEIAYPKYKVYSDVTIKGYVYTIRDGSYDGTSCYYIKYMDDIDISDKVKGIVYVKEAYLKQYIIARDLETLNKAIYYLRLLN